MSRQCCRDLPWSPITAAWVNVAGQCAVRAAATPCWKMVGLVPVWFWPVPGHQRASAFVFCPSYHRSIFLFHPLSSIAEGTGSPRHASTKKSWAHVFCCRVGAQGVQVVVLVTLVMLVMLVARVALALLVTQVVLVTLVMLVMLVARVALAMLVTHGYAGCAGYAGCGGYAGCAGYAGCLGYTGCTSYTQT